jgi:hypothetical protein
VARRCDFVRGGRRNLGFGAPYLISGKAFSPAPPLLQHTDALEEGTEEEEEEREREIIDAWEEGTELGSERRECGDHGRKADPSGA